PAQDPLQLAALQDLVGKPGGQVQRRARLGVAAQTDDAQDDEGANRRGDDDVEQDDGSLEAHERVDPPDVNAAARAALRRTTPLPGPGRWCWCRSGVLARWCRCRPRTTRPRS